MVDIINHLFYSAQEGALDDALNELLEGLWDRIPDSNTNSFFSTKLKNLLDYVSNAPE